MTLTSCYRKPFYDLDLVCDLSMTLTSCVTVTLSMTLTSCDRDPFYYLNLVCDLTFRVIATQRPFLQNSPCSQVCRPSPLHVSLGFLYRIHNIGVARDQGWNFALALSLFSLFRAHERLALYERAIHSHRSFKKAKRVIRSFKNQRFARKTKERIPCSAL